MADKKFYKNPLLLIASVILLLSLIIGVYWYRQQDEQPGGPKQLRTENTVVTNMRPSTAADTTAKADTTKAAPALKDSGNAQQQALFKKMLKLEAGLITRARDYGELTVVVDNMRKESPNFRFIPGIIPLKPGTYRRISSHFGMRFHPIRKVNKMHYGMDISAAIGTPVYATADGTTAVASFGVSGYGTMVKVTHPFGFATIYGHLRSFSCTRGQAIRRGQLIGYVGSTGMSTGPHLHYEIVKNGRRIDPIEFVQFARKIFLNDYD